MQKRIVVIALAVTTAAAIAIWFFTRPVKIGVVLTTDTTIGNEENLAVRFYRHIRPRIGHRPVEYLIHNPPLSEKEIIRAYRKLEKAKVSAIIGGSISRTGIIIAKEAQRSGIPTFGISSSTHTLSGKKDRFYRVTASTRLISTNLASYLTKINTSRLLIFTNMDNKAYADPMADAVKEAFNGECLIIPFVYEDLMFNRMWEWAPNAVLAILPEMDLIHVVRAAKENDPGLLIISTELKWSTFSGPLFNGLRSYSLDGDIQPDYQDMVREFEQLYEVRSSFGIIYTFACLDLLYQAIDAVGPDPGKINAYLGEPRFFDMGYGTVYINEFGDAVMPYHYIKEIVDGKMVLKEKLRVDDFPWDAFK